MEQLISQAESRGVDRHAMAAETMFVSHETYTPARGGSAAAEIHALRSTFGPSADKIVITNTKGFTGHAMGAGIEDVVAIKALETGIVPPVPNFKEPDPDLGELNLSQGGGYPVQYALRLAAGFGSQIAMSAAAEDAHARRPHRHPDELGFGYRIADQAAWQGWLARMPAVTGAHSSRSCSTGCASSTRRLMQACVRVRCRRRPCRRRSSAGAVPVAAPVAAPVDGACHGAGRGRGRAGSTCD